MKKALSMAIMCFILRIGFTQTFEYQFPGNEGKIFQVSENEYVYGIMEYSPKQFSIYSLDHSLKLFQSLQILGTTLHFIIFQKPYLIMTQNTNLFMIISSTMVSL